MTSGGITGQWVGEGGWVTEGGGDTLWRGSPRKVSMAGSLCAELTCARLVMPSTKQIESRMLDFPLPFRPVMALNLGSKLGIVTRVA